MEQAEQRRQEEHAAWWAGLSPAQKQAHRETEARAAEAARERQREAAAAVLAKNEAERAAKAKRDSAKREVISLAKELGGRGMPGAKRLKRSGGMFAPRIKVYEVGRSTGASDGGNGDWGDQSSKSFDTRIFVSGDGEFFHWAEWAKRLYGPMDLKNLAESSTGTRGGYSNAFDFERALDELRRF